MYPTLGFGPASPSTPMHEYARCSLALGPPAGRSAGPSSPPWLRVEIERAACAAWQAGVTYTNATAAVMIACVADVAPSQGVGLVTTHHSIHSSHLTQPDSSARSLVFLPFLRSFAHGVFQIDLMAWGMAPCCSIPLQARARTHTD